MPKRRCATIARQAERHGVAPKASIVVRLDKRGWTMRQVMVAMIANLALAGCASTGYTTAVRPDTTPVPTNMRAAAGLERVVGQNAAALIALFGKPDADVSEGTGRKLQFASAACVLDAYLYPRRSGAPVVTYIDSRQLDGSPIDRASCIAALSRRDGGK